MGITRQAVETARMRACLGGAAFAAAVLLAGCGDGTVSYEILITEPSGNIGRNAGQLFVHWSCDPSVDPATRYQGAQDALWTSVDGVTGHGVLRTQASCPSGALLTVQVDAAARVDTIQTRLACEIFNADGDRVAEETVARGLSTDDPVCRVPVP